MVKLLKAGAGMTLEQLNLILKALPSLDDPKVRVAAVGHGNFDALRSRALYSLSH